LFRISRRYRGENIQVQNSFFCGAYWPPFKALGRGLFQAPQKEEKSKIPWPYYLAHQLAFEGFYEKDAEFSEELFGEGRKT
jgi:hypothetical protein